MALLRKRNGDPIAEAERAVADFSARRPKDPQLFDRVLPSGVAPERETRAPPRHVWRCKFSRLALLLVAPV
jgi:hypothetical protein